MIETFTRIQKAAENIGLVVNTHTTSKMQQHILKV